MHLFVWLVVDVASCLQPQQVELANRLAPTVLSQAVLQFSEVGESIRAANGRSGGSAKLVKAELQAADDTSMRINCLIERRKVFGGKTDEEIVADVPWPTTEGTNEERLLAMAASLDLPQEAAELLAMTERGSEGAPKENMWLNNVPATRESRQHFADQAKNAVLRAVDAKLSRVSMTLRPPELDDEVDTYRVGTLLELTRTVALSLVSQRGLRVRVCVQGPMGTGTFQGVPLSLNGVRRLLEGMDWGESTEELFASKYIRFGDLASESSVDDEDDVFVVLAPQSLVGCSIVEALESFCSKVGEDRTVVLVNPRLGDVASPQGVMSTRGRAGRLEFAKSFREIYKFRLVVPRGRAFFPILGALVKASHDTPYVAYVRTEASVSGASYADSAAKAKAVKDGDLTETYVPIAAFNDAPTDTQIAAALRAYNKQQQELKMARKG